MLKIFLAGTTALAIAGATLAFAQQGAGDFQRVRHWRPSAEDITRIRRCADRRASCRA